MVEVLETGGRLGNQLFEYAFGRIIAENFGYKFTHNLKAHELDNEFKLPRVIPGKEIQQPVQTVNGIHTWASDLLENILNDKSERKILLHGYFQKYIYYKNYKNKLKEWFKFDVNKFNFSNSIGVHLRKGDFKGSISDMPDDYFINILKNESFENIVVTTDEPNHPTVFKIKNEFKNVLLFNDSPYKTLEAFVCFDKLIISHGTFSWWMGFLGKASKVYMPGNVRHEIDLRVTDEQRFTFV